MRLAVDFEDEESERDVDGLIAEISRERMYENARTEYK